MTATTTRLNRERKDLISKYAAAAVCLYGVISINEFVEVFNHYEEAHTTTREVLLALKRLAGTDDVEYSILGDILSGPELQPDFDDYEENVESIRAAQKGKPRYLPDREEFLKYVEFDYREPETPYAELKEYILKHKLTDSGEGIDGVDGDLLDLYEMIRFGVEVASELDYFTQSGYQFKEVDDFKEFARLLMNVHNNTRIYDNNGFTPDEIFEKFERPKLKSLPQEPFIFRATPKVGRNDLCPCGSGLKYKQCHGKQGG